MKDQEQILCYFKIVLPKYQWAIVVDIEVSYKSMPVISYDKYDQAYTSMQKHDRNVGMHWSIPYYAFMFLWLFIEFLLYWVGQNDPSYVFKLWCMCLS